MKTSDPIANLLSTFSNACAVHKLEVEIPFSSFKEQILATLQKEGIIKSFKKVAYGPKEMLAVSLNDKYRTYRRISTPGRRSYAGASKLPRKYREIVIVSTPLGVMTVREAIKKNVGGEILMEVV
jgi:small subunit ribosomal protein S8